MKPMLAAKLTGSGLARLRFPLIASPKVDGMRCTVIDGIPRTRTGKLVPNRYFNKLMQGIDINLDGEVVVGSATDHNAMQNTTSGLMSIEGEPSFTYFVFDDCRTPSWYYERRLQDAITWCRFNAAEGFYSFIMPLSYKYVESLDELLNYEAKCLALGYEGICLRDPKGVYKEGRSTLNQQGLMKLKRFNDAEAEIIGCQELIRQTGESAGVLGALVCTHPETGGIFAIGTGFTAAQREALWGLRESLIGKIAKYKFFSVGVVEAPRFPVFLGFRALEDFDAPPNGNSA